MAYNTMGSRQNVRNFADGYILKRISVNYNSGIYNQISLKFVPKSPINNNPALRQIMPWHKTGDKPSPNPMMA